MTRPPPKKRDLSLKSDRISAVTDSSLLPLVDSEFTLRRIFPRSPIRHFRQRSHTSRNRPRNSSARTSIIFLLPLSFVSLTPLLLFLAPKAILNLRLPAPSFSNPEPSLSSLRTRTNVYPMGSKAWRKELERGTDAVFDIARSRLVGMGVKL